MAAHDWTDNAGRPLTDLVPALVNGSGRRLIGIAGPPGAGKTTVAVSVASQFGDRGAVVPMDGFHLSNTQLRRLGRLDRKGAPDTFDVAGLTTALQRLRSSRGDVYLPGFEHVVDDPIAAEIVISVEAQIIVVEGNYLLLNEQPWQAVRALLDAVIYLDEPWDVVRPRLIARQLAKGKDRERAQAWVDRSDRANFDIIHATMSAADVVVRTPVELAG